MTDQEFHSGFTQVFWTCTALLNGRTISHQAEIREVRGWRLGAIIHRLRHDYGWPVETTFKGNVRVAHYSLPAVCDKAALKLPPSATALGSDGGAE